MQGELWRRWRGEDRPSFCRSRFCRRAEFLTQQPHPPHPHPLSNTQIGIHGLLWPRHNWAWCWCRLMMEKQRVSLSAQHRKDAIYWTCTTSAWLCLNLNCCLCQDITSNCDAHDGSLLALILQCVLWCRCWATLFNCLVVLVLFTSDECWGLCECVVWGRVGVATLLGSDPKFGSTTSPYKRSWLTWQLHILYTYIYMHHHSCQKYFQQCDTFTGIRKHSTAHMYFHKSINKTQFWQITQGRHHLMFFLSFFSKG